MINQNEMSMKQIARIGGLSYLFIIMIGIWGEMFVRGALEVSGDALATATNIANSLDLWRFSITAEIFLLIFGLILLFVFYRLFSPYSRHGARLLVFFNLVSLTIEAVNKLNVLAILVLLSPHETGAVAVAAGVAQQVNFYLSLHSYGFGLSLVFFGCVCILLGYLILSSRVLPPLLGWLMPIAGLSYIINSLAMIVAPNLSGALFPWILLPPFITESSVCLWLLIKGVKQEAVTPALKT
ncbi:MAG: DUF4386 domain-containing protein [Wenzhouxiangellaceae bacterium]